MDTSELYINMCDKAEEIQALKKFEDGDLIATPIWSGINDTFKWATEYLGRSSVSKTSPPSKPILLLVELEDVGEYEKYSDITWVPRLDQLADLILTWNKEISTAFFANINSNSQFRGISERGFDSLEKHLLSFLMCERYNKIFDVILNQWVIKIVPCIV